MTTDIDFDLTATQWETLKALRTPAPDHRDLNPLNLHVLQELIALGLATRAEGRPTLTPKGREVVIRGSPRLWDVAA